MIENNSIKLGTFLGPYQSQGELRHPQQSYGDHPCDGPGGVPRLLQHQHPVQGVAAQEGHLGGLAVQVLRGQVFNQGPESRYGLI